ncbi:hypothetical protein HK407_01g01380 [Ordospora pajunii]|uniref:uncharacterized protein n=1 Tax=Ordospora pajunii TaxID=3039483 RepID=UPI0029528669|nr:uncharacterized protein HK407_01g01380 [Ordospora pajunii]KAH9412245.1 hypothetical protein HK407_01g01380 [Ordospora pajunii]
MKHIVQLMLLAYAMCFSRDIISTNHSMNTIRYMTAHQSPHFLAVMYPQGVIPQLIGVPVHGVFEAVYEQRKALVVVFRMNRRCAIDVTCEKQLCRVWEYSPHIEEGVVIRSFGIVGGQVVWTDVMTDWIVIPDFTVQFVAFNIFGIVLTLMLKVYCAPQKPERAKAKDNE